MASFASEAAASLVYDGTILFPFDIECLEKGEFINNAVIDFYLKYLLREWLNDSQRHRIQLFDSVLLENIAEKVRNKSTSHLNILEKDFIIMPTNLHEHWFLVVLCYARNAIAENDHPDEKPEILIFDSAKNYLSTKRSSFLRLFRSLIKNEVAQLLKESCQEIGSLTKKLPCVVMPTPQQNNDVDCGVFLLENVERFLNDKFELPAEIRQTVTIVSDPDCYTNTIEVKRETVKTIIKSLAENTVVHVFATGSVRKESVGNGIQV